MRIDGLYGYLQDLLLDSPRPSKYGASIALQGYPFVAVFVSFKVEYASVTIGDVVIVVSV